MRDSEEREYTVDWLQYERQQPMYDEDINNFYASVLKEVPAHVEMLDSDFKGAFHEWLQGHTLSYFTGMEKFPARDVIQGVTQYIDDLYQRYGSLQIFENDYKYHWRLNENIEYKTLDTLDRRPLLISMPFPYHGDIHPDMDEILEKCLKLKIDVHVDSAWISCIRGIGFNYDHPAIKSFAVSLSKGGLGGTRIGVRYCRVRPDGPVTLMNQFNMNQQPLMWIGQRFCEMLGPEYFWKKYMDKYRKVCFDFDLVESKAIHLAKTKEGKPVGVRSLLRAL